MIRREKSEKNFLICVHNARFIKQSISKHILFECFQHSHLLPSHPPHGTPLDFSHPALHGAESIGGGEGGGEAELAVWSGAFRNPLTRGRKIQNLLSDEIKCNKGALGINSEREAFALKAYMSCVSLS